MLGGGSAGAHAREGDASTLPFSSLPWADVVVTTGEKLAPEGGATISLSTDNATTDFATTIKDYCIEENFYSLITEVLSRLFGRLLEDFYHKRGRKSTRTRNGQNPRDGLEALFACLSVVARSVFRACAAGA